MSKRQTKWLPVADAMAAVGARDESKFLAAAEKTLALRDICGVTHVDVTKMRTAINAAKKEVAGAVESSNPPHYDELKTALLRYRVTDGYQKSVEKREAKIRELRHLMDEAAYPYDRAKFQKKLEAAQVKLAQIHEKHVVDAKKLEKILRLEMDDDDIQDAAIREEEVEYDSKLDPDHPHK
jgi:hypothetical protein